MYTKKERLLKKACGREKMVREGETWEHPWIKSGVSCVDSGVGPIEIGTNMQSHENMRDQGLQIFALFRAEMCTRNEPGEERGPC